MKVGYAVCPFMSLSHGCGRLGEDSRLLTPIALDAGGLRVALLLFILLSLSHTAVRGVRGNFASSRLVTGGSAPCTLNLHACIFPLSFISVF